MYHVLSLSLMHDLARNIYLSYPSPTILPPSLFLLLLPLFDLVSLYPLPSFLPSFLPLYLYLPPSSSPFLHSTYSPSILQETSRKFKKRG